ncbi:Phospholipase-like protein [Corchorus capsularis]|uniref:Phospholipase-like protein n=1 Tax=Corchorus capsularis TaxID=210143 RepID=A0A1R3IPA7_COCAP|nr:Phospholipase-like protein [Corchorus capsularis]
MQDDYNHEGQNSANLSNQGSSCEISDWLGEYGISQMFLVADTLYSDLVVTKFIAKLESNTKSSVNFSSFKELEGERQTIGDYCFPKSLVSTFEAIMNAHGDVARNSHFGPRLIEDAYVLFCAAIKEMDDLPLHQVTEETVFKWRDAIKDAMRVGCDVEFAWKHLETIAYAYFGLKARNDRKGLEQSIAKLTQVEKSLRQELEMKVNEVKVLKAKEEELSSPQCNKCQEIADCFQNKTVGLFRS